nr:MarR family winged helix-turn-helix transcriptional regulator [Curtobacterium pusillum]
MSGCWPGAPEPEAAPAARRPRCTGVGALAVIELLFRAVKLCRLRNATSIASSKQLNAAQYAGDVTEERDDAERLLRAQLDRLWVRQTLRASLIESRGGLDPTARVILRAVDHFGAVRSMAIADATGLSRPVISRRVASLVESGYLGTAPDPADGRASLVSIAPAGRALLDTLDVAGAEVFDDLTGAFVTRELRTLAGLLARLNDRADAVLGIGATARGDSA